MKAFLAFAAAYLVSCGSMANGQFVAINESVPVVLQATTNGISHTLDQRLYQRSNNGSFDGGLARKDAIFSRQMTVEIWPSGMTLKIVDHDRSRWAIYSGSASNSFPKAMTLMVSNGAAPDWIGGTWPTTITLTE